MAVEVPRARIAMLGYPRLFNAGNPFGDKISQAADVLNQVISGAVATAAATNSPRIRFVDVSQEFLHHGTGAAVPYINDNPADPMAPANFHPNVLGNLLGYYQALRNDDVLAGDPLVHSTL
ncbi:MAG: hypothetical protein M3021_08250 [Actinomycetota bacterium]|nr:hypothetical protein [Actinomycetota bacterium]